MSENHKRGERFLRERRLKALKVSHRAALEELTKRACYESLASFARYIWEVCNPGTPLKWSWHMTAICDHLEAWCKGETQRLMINIPPGHSKTFLVSIAAPCWWWLHNPESRWICASYNMELARKINLDRRAVLNSPEYARLQPSWSKAEGRWNKEAFFNDKQGFMMAATPKTGITGLHADFLLIDDPIKPQDVWGPALKGHVEWFKNTASTRFRDYAKSRIAIVMQRLHVHDLCGTLLKEEPGIWDVLCLPAEFDPTNAAHTSIGFKDPRTKAGELLCPSRFSMAVLNEKRTRLGSSAYSTQFLQNPIIGSGRIFNIDWFRFWAPNEDGLPGIVDEWIGSIDAAFNLTSDSDYLVIQIWARIDNKMYLYRQWRERWEYHDLEKFMIGTAVGNGGYSGGLVKEYPQVERWLIEKAANGGALISRMRRTLGGNYHIQEVTPTESKQARAQAVAPLIESGHILLPLNAEFTPGFVDECKAFPVSKRNDQVDAFTQAVNDRIHMLGTGGYKTTAQKLRGRTEVEPLKDIRGGNRIVEPQAGWARTARRDIRGAGRVTNR